MKLIGYIYTRNHGSTLSNFASFYIAKDKRLSLDILNRSQHSGETNKDHLFFNQTRRKASSFPWSAPNE